MSQELRDLITEEMKEKVYEELPIKVKQKFNSKVIEKRINAAADFADFIEEKIEDEVRELVIMLISQYEAQKGDYEEAKRERII